MPPVRPSSKRVAAGSADPNPRNGRCSTGPRFALGPPNGVSLVRRRRRRIAAGEPGRLVGMVRPCHFPLTLLTSTRRGRSRRVARAQAEAQKAYLAPASTRRGALCVRGNHGRDRRRRRRSTRGVGALVGERVVCACADARRGGGAGRAWPALVESACPAPRRMPRTRDRRSRAATARRCCSRMSASRQSPASGSVGDVPRKLGRLATRKPCRGERQRPIHSRRVLTAAEPDLRGVVTRLRAGGGELRGVALLDRLITSGASPLYGESVDPLREELARGSPC